MLCQENSGNPGSKVSDFFPLQIVKLCQSTIRGEVELYLCRLSGTFSREKPSGNRLMSLAQGCQIFLGTIYQNGKNLPNDHNMHKIAVKYTKWP
jgi:hypothetical protein